MHIKDYAFKNLSFSELFQVYVDDFDRLDSFYEINPFDEAAIERKASAISSKGDRHGTAEILHSFNKQFDVDQATIKNINRLKKDDALAIVTGQQLGLYGGPVYTMFKTITAIHLANRLEKKWTRPVVPVFWLADEDHDYDEIRTVNILNGDGLESFSLPKKNGVIPPVSEIILPKELHPLKKQIRSTLIDTDFSNDLWELLNSCFSTGSTFLGGFGQFMSRLFSKHGLVLAGSNNSVVKEETKRVLKKTIRKADDITSALESQSQKISKRYHQQVTLNKSHLFFLDPKAGRTKIVHEKNNWRTSTGHQWSAKELLSDIDEQPALFSPDVFLRPVIQDALLPTLGYVGGPGELAYYGQMKTFYHCFDQKMPVIYPRFSGTFLEPAIVRIFNELPFEINEYNSRIEDLESAFVDRTEQLDIETLFDTWKEEYSSVSTSYEQSIKEVDESLEGAAEKAKAHFSNELDQLKSKVYRAIKKREKTQMARILRVQQNLFPGRNLQERTLSGIYYMNKFGLDIWDRLLEEMESGESLDQHKLIYL